MTQQQEPSKKRRLLDAVQWASDAVSLIEELTDVFDEEFDDLVKKHEDEVDELQEDLDNSQDNLSDLKAAVAVYLDAGDRLADNAGGGPEVVAIYTRMAGEARAVLEGLL